MERASRLVGKVMSKAKAVDLDGLVRAAWPGAVGKQIAAHAHPDRMVRTRLVVEVEDEIWQRNLFGMSRQILDRLRLLLGPGVVEEVHFRVLPLRRQPQKARVAQPALAMDEADQIADPVLRNIYKNSRKAQA